LEQPPTKHSASLWHAFLKLVPSTRSWCALPGGTAIARSPTGVGAPGSPVGGASGPGAGSGAGAGAGEPVSLTGAGQAHEPQRTAARSATREERAMAPTLLERPRRDPPAIDLEWGRVPAVHPLRAAAAAAALAAALAAGPPAARAGDPSQVWRTIETEHFQVHYYEPHLDIARKVAASAEIAHRTLTAALGHAPEQKTHIIVVDDTDGSNGFASVLPRNRVTLYASAPPD